MSHRRPDYWAWLPALAIGDLDVTVYRKWKHAAESPVTFEEVSQDAIACVTETPSSVRGEASKGIGLTRLRRLKFRR